MEINADFSQAVSVRPGDVDWIPSPLPGVDRRMLDRIGGEIARATSIVRYAKNSRFDRHVHDLGEEFVVLEGVFSDASGDFPAGSYVRNPPGSDHAPWSDEGCVIFVKLRQFAIDDLERVVVAADTSPHWVPKDDQVSVLPMHKFGDERVALLNFEPGSTFPAFGRKGGTEVFVLDGELEMDGEIYPQHSWIRLPDGWTVDLKSEKGCRLWAKSGHLAPAQ